MHTDSNPRYREAFDVSNRAVYEGSIVKTIVDKEREEIKKKSAALLLLAPAAYQFTRKHQAVIRTQGFRLQYSRDTQQIEYSWRF